MDFQKMMQQAQEMQFKLQEVQEKLKDIEVEAAVAVVGDDRAVFRVEGERVRVAMSTLYLGDRVVRRAVEVAAA